ncbi:TPA: dihydrodipicolinate synthase family protein [Candidatus Poribacteria bacterium]|nr:dihydrodipicolinate synthase family protein [Candidatus Poribacteria bacterium]
MNNPRFEGIFPPVVTPLDEHERIDEQGFVTQLNRLIDNGVHGIYLLGTSGEFVSLTNEERTRAIEIALSAVNGRVPIICGCMDSSTKRVIKNIETAQELGVKAIATTPPYYYPPHSDADIMAFYKSIAASTDLPVVIYNIPQTTKVAIPPEVVRQLNESVDNIAGIKDSTGDWTNFLNLLAYLGDSDKFSILLGSYTVGGAAIMLGAEGAVMSIANVDPKTPVQLYEAARQGRIAEVKRLQLKLLSLGKLYSYGTPASCLKTCLELMGVCRAYTTSPIMPVSESGREELRRLLKEHGLIR